MLKSVWRYNFIRLFRLIKNEHPLTESDFKRASKTLKPQLVPTGVKAYMQPDEMLVLANRSSNPLKRGLILPNGIGIVDADYYNNDDNEGEIFPIGESQPQRYDYSKRRTYRPRHFYAILKGR